jgi:predicted dehydrogenase
MADKLRWGVLATGSIAHRFAKGLKMSRTGVLAAVGSRTLEKAEDFAREHGGKGYGTYEGVLADSSVGAIYIALPHHMHAEWTINCARAGKHVLCEKPFTLNAADAERALEEVRRAGVFFMEAFMYRCHPQTRELRRLVREGTIGKPLIVNAEFGFTSSRGWENFRTVRALGGGGLMDVGTYCVSMSRLVADEEPSRCEYAAFIGERGYDDYGAGCLLFPGGMTAMIGTGIHATLSNTVSIYGTEGRIFVPSPWFCDKPFEVHCQGEQVRSVDKSGVDLYGEEADAVAQFLDARECPCMTWDDTLGNMRALDAMRESAGLKFGDA